MTTPNPRPRAPAARAFAAAIGLSIAVAACSGDTDPDAETASDDMAEGTMTDMDSGSPLTEEEIEEAAPGIEDVDPSGDRPTTADLETEEDIDVVDEDTQPREE